MTYKETLFFVAKCLTINHEAHNRSIVEQALQSNTVDWDEVVKLSTAHFVFPALYCNLKRASFLSYLPEDLVDYMKYITDLNRKRNEEIIAQAKELNTLLLEHDITPIFLKGTGNLLEGLYEDIAERMVGDIDFLFSKEDYPKAIELLTSNDYFISSKTGPIYPGNKHYPRLININKIAAVEIHKELLRKKYSSEFNYDFIINSYLKFDKIKVMSYENQFLLTIAAAQINDFGFTDKNLLLRNAYDIFLLSKKNITKNVFKKLNILKYPLRCYLVCCYEVFNKPETLRYNSSKKIKKYLILFYKYLDNQRLLEQNILKRKKEKKKKIIYNKFITIYKSFYLSEYRIYLIKKLEQKFLK